MVSDRWTYLKEEELDLTPLSKTEKLAARCNGNYWLISVGPRGKQIYNRASNGLECHLSLEESLVDPRVTYRYWWCPHCMRQIPCEPPTYSSFHIAKDPAHPHHFRQVLETRPGYFEELYFQYPDAYKEHKDQAYRYLNSLPKKERKKLLTKKIT